MTSWIRRWTDHMRTMRVVGLAFVVAFVSGIVLCFSNVVGAPGIESALILGILLPPFLGAASARLTQRSLSDNPDVPTKTLLKRGLQFSLTLTALPCALLLLNLIRVPICAPLEGVAFLLLGPVLGVVYATLWGILVGVITPRIWLATSVVLLLPFGSAAIVLLGFYFSPAIFGFGHFFGYFPGTLYDPDITVTNTYLWFRAFTVLRIITLSAVLILLRAHQAPLTFFSLFRNPLSTLALVGIVTVASGDVYATSFGFRSTSNSIAEALGGRAETPECVVIVPQEMPLENARRLAEDCAFRIHAAGQSLGLRQTERVTAYFFRNAGEKRELMGAARTYIAKPWRNEVYLQVNQWPHPVLFHEIAHVVAGNIGRGPFRIAGHFEGLLPSPALIEGLAVAVAWEAREGLTPHQWARAMHEQGLRPRLSDIDGLSFLLQPASRAYTASGSFIRWLLDTRGRRIVRRLYETADWQNTLGQSLQEAEAAWIQYLETEVVLPPEASALAQARFDRPGLFSQVCPHAIANLITGLRNEMVRGDFERSEQTCREILAIDPGHVGARTAYIASLAQHGRDQDAQAQLAVLETPPRAAAPSIQLAKLALADGRWRHGDRDGAAAILNELVNHPQSEASRRQIQVRLLGLNDPNPVVADSLRTLLAPRRQYTHDAAIIMGAIAQLDRRRDDGLAAYLMGRQLLMRQRFELAAPFFAEASERGLPLDTLRRELLRMQAITAFGQGQLATSTAAWRRLQNASENTPGTHAIAADWLDRIQWEYDRAPDRSESTEN